MEENEGATSEYYTINCGEENAGLVAADENQELPEGYIQICPELANEDEAEVTGDPQFMNTIFVTCQPENEGDEVSANASGEQIGFYIDRNMMQSGQQLVDGRIVLTQEGEIDASHGSIILQDPSGVLQQTSDGNTVIYVTAENVVGNIPQNDKLMRLAHIAQCAKYESMNNDCIINVNGDEVAGYLREGDAIATAGVSNVSAVEAYGGEYFINPRIVTCEGDIDKEVSVIHGVSSEPMNHSLLNGETSSSRSAEDVYLIQENYDNPNSSIGETMFSTESSIIAQRNESFKKKISEQCKLSAPMLVKTVDNPGADDSYIPAEGLESQKKGKDDLNNETQPTVSQEVQPTVIRRGSSLIIADKKTKFVIEDDIAMDAESVPTQGSNDMEHENVEEQHENVPESMEHNTENTSDKEDEIPADNRSVGSFVESHHSDDLEDQDSVSSNHFIDNYSMETDVSSHSATSEVSTKLVDKDICNPVPCDSEEMEPVKNGNFQSLSRFKAVEETSSSQIPEVTDSGTKSNSDEQREVESIPEIIMKPPKKTYTRTRKLLKNRMNEENEKKVAGIENDLRLLSDPNFQATSFDESEESTGKVELSPKTVSEEAEEQAEQALPRKRTRRSQASPSGPPPSKRRKPNSSTVQSEFNSIGNDIDSNPIGSSMGNKATGVESNDANADSESNAQPKKKRQSSRIVNEMESNQLEVEANDAAGIESVPATSMNDPSSSTNKKVTSPSRKKALSKIFKNPVDGKKIVKSLGRKVTTLQISNTSSKWFYRKPGGKTKAGSSYDPSKEYIFTDSDDSSSCIDKSAGTSTSPKRGRPLGSRNKLVNDNDTWNKLLQSNPSNIKNESYLSKIKRRLAKRYEGTSSLESVPDLSSEKILPNDRTLSQPKKKQELTVYNRIQTVNIETPGSETNSPDNYSCHICQYETQRLQNYVLHAKTCLPTSVECRFDEEVDMDRRQRIRGDFHLEEPPISRIPFAAIDEPEENSIETLDDKTSDQGVESMFLSAQSNGGDFQADDVAWLNDKLGYWPVWIESIDATGRWGAVYLIDHPSKKSNKMRITLRKLTTFHKSDFNIKLLEEEKTKVNFLKAVQKAEEFVRKRVIGDQVEAKDFFKLDVNGGVENGEGECSEPEDPVQKFSTDIWEFIKDGKLDDYLVDVYERVQPSERNRKFFSSVVNEKNELADCNWFGPLGNSERRDMMKYLVQLFNKRCEKEFVHLVGYMYQVWCPEAIVNAASALKGIPREEAERLIEDPDFVKTLVAT